MTVKSAGVAQGQEPHLKRALGFWEVTAGGVGIIVGAGIYVLIGAATAEAGSAVWVAFILAAALSALTGLSYCELASMFPSAAAEYEYTRQAFHPRLAFVVGWTMIAGLVVAAATVALGFGRYLGNFADVGPRAGAYALLAGVVLIALTGIKQSARLTLVLSSIQVGGLLLVIALGLTSFSGVEQGAAKGLSGVIGAAALVFFAFIGFDEVITLSEETKDPSRTVPRALLTSLAISAALYVAVAIVAVGALGSETLGASERPLADVIGVAIGGRSVDLVAAIALISTMNTTLLSVTAASRLVYGMSLSGALPGELGRVRAATQVPWLAVLAVTAAAGAFVAFGDLELIAGVTDFAVYLVFLAVNGSVIVLRYRQPQAVRPFRVPIAIKRVLVVPVLGLLSTALMLTQLERESALIGLGLTAAGTVGAYGAGRPWSRRRRSLE